MLLPFWRNNKNIAFEEQTLRKNANIALFQERSNDLESELALGNLDQAQFDALKLELQQSLLADVSADEQQATATGAAKRKSSESRSGFSASTAIPYVLVILLPLVAYALYDRWGYLEDVQLMGLFQRTVNNVDNVQEAQTLIVELGEIVQENSELPWAWYFLAENFASLGMFNEAEIAYQQSASKLEESPEKALVLGRVALAKYINADLQMTPDIMQVIETAREINPNEISILQLLASDAEQNQDYQAAIEYWRLLIQSNPNSEQAQALRANIAAAQALMEGDGQEVASGPAIDVSLTLADGIELDPNLRIFIAARNAEREGMPPLAALSLNVADLPTTVRLDNSAAVGAFNLSSAETIYVSALVSFTGSANPQSGDYRVVSDSFSPNGQHAIIELVIDERIE